MSTKIFLQEYPFSDTREVYGMITAAQAGRYQLSIEKLLRMVPRVCSATGSDRLFSKGNPFNLSSSFLEPYQAQIPIDRGMRGEVRSAPAIGAFSAKLCRHSFSRVL